MKLHIDTTTIKRATVYLYLKNKVYKKTGRYPLKLINSLLNKHGLKIEDVKDISVNPGPGSFTGLRVGTSIVNTLNFTLKRNKIVLPKYLDKETEKS